MALSAAAKRVYEADFETKFSTYPVITADIIYEGGALMASSGYAAPISGTDALFVGFADETVDNSAGQSGDLNVNVKTSGYVKLSVTGVTAVTDIGSPVYATADGTFTLTSSGTRIGTIFRWISGTNAIVAFASHAGKEMVRPRDATVLDDLTVNGSILMVTDDEVLAIGAGTDFSLLWSTGDASNHAAVLALGASQALHLTDQAAKATDWNLSADTNPTLYLHSDTTPATDYLRIGNHTGSAADIDLVGGATLNFMIDGTAAMAMTATSLTLADAFNVVANTTTGTKIGTAVGQKLGFWNATPVVQPAAAAQAALTDSSGGSDDGTIEAVGNTMSGDVSGAINNNFSELHTLVTAIRTALVNTGIIKGAA